MLLAHFPLFIDIIFKAFTRFINMIVPTYTDEQIFRELMDDFPSVKRQTKKVGDGMLKKMPHGRIGMEKGRFRSTRKDFRSKNGNQWIVSTHCIEGSTRWWSVCYCEVENGYGTKSYFYLRAINSPHPYYVEVIPHAIRRIRERYINNFQEYYFAEASINDICEFAIFTPHDCGVFLAAGKVRSDGHFHNFTDKDGNTPGVVVMKNQMFFARRTPLGNFIFKTYITPDNEKGTRKHEFTLMMFGLWRAANPQHFGKTNKDQLKMIEVLWKLCPNMHRHLHCIHERFVPLYP